MGDLPSLLQALMPVVWWKDLIGSYSKRRVYLWDVLTLSEVPAYVGRKFLP